jgi:hypothetical protein
MEAVSTLQGNGHGSNTKISKIMKFNNLCWHDAIIKNIQIDRNNPGNIDTIAIKILWPDNQLNDVIFEDVYWSRMTLGFGIVADECIYEAFITLNDDPDLVSFFSRWKGMITGLNCYVVKTSSTGSEIKIIAKNIRLI